MIKTVVYPVDTPLGTMLIHEEKEVPVDLTFSGEIQGLEHGEYPPPPMVTTLMQAIEQYFQGEDPDTTYAEKLLANMEVTPFERSVLIEVINIPRGETASYGEVAARAGFPRAARAVGNVMRSNPFPVIIPCHRVIKGDGSLGGYGGYEHLKARLLRSEGVEVAYPTSACCYPT
jgi:methylated-DNA-[protein]-cysteine S-methyltransferase